MTQPNTDLLYETLDRVLDANVVGTWFQGAWIDVRYPEILDDDLCGTTACFAGHTLLALGGNILTRRVTPQTWCSDGCGCQPPYVEAYGIEMPGHILVTTEHIAEEARLALGLSPEQADALFHSENRLTDLKATVDQIAATH